LTAKQDWRTPQASPFLIAPRSEAGAITKSAAVTPPKTLSERPIDEEGTANHIFCWKITPGARIQAIHGIVTHDHVMFRSNSINCSLVRKKRRQHAPKLRVELTFNLLINMAGILTFLRGFMRVKGIDVLEM